MHEEEWEREEDVGWKERRRWEGQRKREGRNRTLGCNNQKNSLYKMLCQPTCGRNAEVTKLRVILGYYSILKTKTKRRVIFIKKALCVQVFCMQWCSTHDQGAL